MDDIEDAPFDLIAIGNFLICMETSIEPILEITYQIDDGNCGGYIP